MSVVKFNLSAILLFFVHSIRRRSKFGAYCDETVVLYDRVPVVGARGTLSFDGG